MAHDKGTIWWDFDGTLITRPFMWSEAGHRFLNHRSPDHQISREQLGIALQTGLPWHRADLGHPELATPTLWWESIYRRYFEAFRQLGYELPDGEALTAIRQDIVDASRYSLFEDVVPALDQLRSMPTAGPRVPSERRPYWFARQPGLTAEPMIYRRC